jgi:AmmeMemoRadiSam system protein B
MEEYPKLRNVDIMPIEVSGKKLLYLRDRLDISPELTLPIESAGIISLFDGRNSLRDIQASIVRQSGFQLISRENIMKIVEILNSNFYLDNDNFRRKKDEVENTFRKEPIRRASHAGKSYESSPERLRSQINRFFLDPEGPGSLPELGQGDNIRGIIAPHIDFMRGGPCYGWAYHRLAQDCNAELFIIFGTAHMPTQNLFVLTEKDFETPFGIQKTDKEFVRSIILETGEDLLKDEFLHRSEHTIEFQIIFLQYLYAQKRDIQIIPILCGSFHDFIKNENLPEDNEQISKVIKAIRASIKRSHKRTCIIASADLSHIGPQFGDPTPVLSYHLSKIRNDDMQMLRFIESMDRNGFYRFIMKEKDRRNICGLPPIYALLSTIECDRAEIIKYSQAHHPQATVTFSSIVFFESGNREVSLKQK